MIDVLKSLYVLMVRSEFLCCSTCKIISCICSCRMTPAINHVYFT